MRVGGGGALPAQLGCCACCCGCCTPAADGGGVAGDSSRPDGPGAAGWLCCCANLHIELRAWQCGDVAESRVWTGNNRVLQSEAYIVPPYPAQFQARTSLPWPAS